MALQDAIKRKLSNKYDPANIFLETYNHVWFENEEPNNKTKSEKLADATKGEKSTDLLPMPVLEGDEEVKVGKGLKF